MREADYTVCVSFLSKFFALSDDLVELRAIPNDGGGAKDRIFLGQGHGANLARFCQVHDIPGVAVYFGCSTRKPGSRQGRKEDLSELIACWVDIDIYHLGLTVDEVVAALNACACPPSFIIFSGWGVHAYWLLREALPAEALDEHEAVLKRLCAVFCGDPLPAQSAAVMRLPGTHHSKPDKVSGEPGWRKCVVLAEHELLYELSDLAEMLDGLPVQLVPAGAAPAAAQPETNSDPFEAFAALKRMDIEAELAEMKLHDPENKGMGVHRVRRDAAASLVARGHDDAVIFDRLMAETERAYFEAGEAWSPSRVRIEEKKLRDEIASAHAKGWAPKADKVVQLRPGQQSQPEEAAVDPAPEFMGYPLNDLGNAARLLSAHATALRYVLAIGWHVWDRRRFRYDPEGGKARRLAHDVVKTMLLAAWKGEGTAKSKEKIVKFAIQCANSGRLANMLHEAEPYQAIEAGALDADIMLLNCLNGTVDLRTGTLRPHAQADLLSKLCNAAYTADAACPQWEKFVSEIFGGDEDLVGFVQRGLGYSLTGSTREQVLFIMHGSGSNGKTVLIETIQSVLGDYVKRSPADTWASKPAGALTNDVAALVGARLVSVVETEQDRHLAEALVKQASGGDTITARFHHKEFFSFIPQFKLWFATNHRPKIKGSDYAIWRRIYLLPFTVKFVDADKVEGSQKVKDPDLREKLKLEHDGILGWMVKGCLEWQKIGLKPPEAVRLATEAYQDSQDNVTGFVRDACHQSRGIQCANKLLYAAYELWCGENDEEPVPVRAFAGKLDEQGFPPGKRTSSERQRQGIDVNGEYKEKLDALAAAAAAAAAAAQ